MSQPAALPTLGHQLNQLYEKNQETFALLGFVTFLVCVYICFSYISEVNESVTALLLVVGVCAMLKMQNEFSPLIRLQFNGRTII